MHHFSWQTLQSFFSPSSPVRCRGLYAGLCALILGLSTNCLHSADSMRPAPSQQNVAPQDTTPPDAAPLGVPPFGTAATTKETANPDLPEGDLWNEKEVQKKLMSMVRRGVVIIQAVNHAGTQVPSKWSGTGFLVDKSQGILATNAHVAGYHSIPVNGSHGAYLSVASYDVKFGDGTVLNAQLLYVDPTFDFAFLKVDPSKLPSNSLELIFADKPVELNESIFSLGNSSREEFSVISGVVYDIYSSIGPFMEHSFRYSGTTTGGASGSPIFNAKGKIVGIIYGGLQQQIAGYALHGRYVQEALQTLQKQGKPKRQDLGVRLFYQSVDDLCEAGLMDAATAQDYLARFPHVSKKIVCVSSLIAGSPAQKVLQEGDIVWMVQGTVIGPELLTISHMIDHASDHVNMTVIRKGKKLTVSVPVAAFDRTPYERFVVFAGTAFFETSLHTRLATGDPNPGVYATMTSESCAFDIPGYGLVKISEIDGHPITSLNDLIRLIPLLNQEKRIEIRYVFTGVNHSIAGPMVGSQSLFAIFKYTKQFENPKEFVCDATTQQWTVKEISDNTAKQTP